MFGKIAGFEFRYQIRQPVFWVVSTIFFLLTLLAMTVPNVQIGSGGNVLKNAAFAIAQTHGILSVFYMFVTTAFVANVITRDVETGFGPIVHATRMSKFDYLFGRFTGAFGAVALSFLAVPLAIFLGAAAGPFLPWVDSETLGPNTLEPYLYAYFGLALPAIFVTSAFFFTLSTVTRSMMATYVGVIGFLIAWTVMSVVLDKPEYRQIMAYAEPFGLAGYGEATRYWTATERNTLIPPLEGAVVWGRVLWIGISLLVIAAAYPLFRVEARGAKNRKQEKLKALGEKTDTAPERSGPLPKPTYGFGTAMVQLWARTKFEMGQVFKSPAYFVLLALGLFNAGAALWFGNEIYGAPIYPLTRKMVETLEGTFSIIPMIIAIYYAGELVWRERDRRTAEIVDATAVPDWAFVLPKTLAISLVLFSTLLVSVAAALLVQLGRGFTDFQLENYLGWYLLPQTLGWTLMAVLAVFLQVLSPHKFVGWALMLVFFISSLVTGQLGLDHVLYNFGRSPDGGRAVSDFNGIGNLWIAQAWLRVYWTAFCLLLLVLAYALWRRGTETRLMPRLARLPHRLKGAPGVIAALAVLVFAGVGAYIFVNTNVWNEYRNNEYEERWLADYEKVLYNAYKDVDQPTITDVKLNVELFPTEPRVVTAGTYVLENRTGKPIADLHVRGASPDLKVDFEVPGARRVKDYPRFKYAIYRFDTPMAPGERRTIAFRTELSQRGFRNSANLFRVTDNGTFISNGEITPFVGISRSQLHRDRTTRRKHDLPPELPTPAIGTPGADRFNYLRHDSGFVSADITVTTDAGQTPIAPGRKVSDTTANGRRTAHFVSDAPIIHFFSIQSARYAVKTREHKGVQMAVYYHPGHDWNVDRMLTAGELSLDYFQANFSPYQFHQIRFIEFPAYQGSFAQAFANTVPWSEDLGFIANVTDKDKIDFVTYVGAHEVAHQWWAHQVLGADVQGMTVLSETLAQYSALMVMERLYGPDKIRKFLKFELDNYLRSRGGDALGERPLGLVENQGYIHYRKGALVMYLLKDVMGEDKVNAALRQVIDQHAFKSPPYPTSRALIDALRVQAAGNQEQLNLINDLFNEIIIYDLQATSARVCKRSDGRFEVTLAVNARKLRADRKGKETERPMDEVFDIGLFTAEPGKEDFGPEDVLLFQRVPLKSGVTTLPPFVVARAPTWVGVDPYNKRIDRNSDDNLIKAEACRSGEVTRR